VSCPYSWLIPYRRFSAEVVAAGIDAYTTERIEYRDLNGLLSDLELVPPEMDIREEKMYQKLVEENKTKQIEKASDKDAIRPAHTTVFYWIAFACRRIEILLMQMQKELVHEQKRRTIEIELPAESTIENPNSDKAATSDKANTLNLLSFATVAAVLLHNCKEHIWQKLRSYFLIKAESRKDIFTDTVVQMFTTQTFEPSLF
jgi:hypothetical protein